MKQYAPGDILIDNTGARWRVYGTYATLVTLERVRDDDFVIYRVDELEKYGLKKEEKQP